MAGRRPRELYRDPARGKVAGICAGLARYFDWPVWPIRLALVVLAVFTQFFPLFAVYLIAWFVLDPVSDYSPPGLRGRVDGWVRHSRERWEDGQERPTVEISDSPAAGAADKTKSGQGSPRGQSSTENGSMRDVPPADLQAIEDLLAELEQRVQGIERHVTSPAYVLRQQFLHL